MHISLNKMFVFFILNDIIEFYEYKGQKFTYDLVHIRSLFYLLSFTSKSKELSVHNGTLYVMKLYKT